MLEKDVYEMDFSISDGSSAMVTEQSYRKVFRADGEGAAQKTSISVGENASFFYLPSPTIPFAGSRFCGETIVRLRPSSKFFLCDILACGRAGMGEKFLFDSYRSRTSVYVGEELAFLDNCRLLPGEAEPGGLGFFEGFPYQGFFYLHGFATDRLPEEPGLEIAGSQAKQGVSVRVLAQNGEDIMRFARKIMASAGG